jgi:hypothetical protein
MNHLGLLSEGKIIRLIQVNELDLCRTRISGQELLQQAKREVLIQ